ncbi:fibronectin type III domain-containing protein 7-like [Periophthalmus magnuspinnatus]|uniref:fibronectin type III domain-containing protein 7-like n=1 Tax=Periophthalmus magnuspinnatus TaxID=409849 RepID=UPI0024368845|nr:fibronectin type III domain-containing protein 7-like [Periophthalmus magnuspinnatus]
MSTQCNVSGLQCGKRYNVTVSAHNDACSSQGVPSDTAYLTTEPCPPSNIEATMQCTQLTATISWNQSNFAVGYIAYINDTQGNIMSCVAPPTNTSCVISGLGCDLVYNAWVIAKGDQYNSSESTAIPLISAPCSPQNITAQVNCSLDGGAIVSWTANAGANFSVTSVVNGSQQTLCTTQQNSCSLSGLGCGQSYSLSLTATNNQCSITASTHPSLNTRLCPLTGVSTSRDCASSNVTVNWQTSTGANYYNATLIPDSGVSYHCSSESSTSCSIDGLPCGQNFSVSVSASDAQCTINSADQLSETTAPCVPTNINAEMNCSTDTAAVSWTGSSGAENYTVTGQSTTGNVSCEAVGLTCNLTNLACGTQYTIQVVARNSACSSAPSQAITLDTGKATNKKVLAWDIIILVISNIPFQLPVHLKMWMLSLPVNQTI